MTNSLQVLNYITTPRLPFKRNFKKAEKQLLDNIYPLGNYSRIDANGRIWFYGDNNQNVSDTYITEETLLKITPHRSKISTFKKLYDTLGHKQLYILNKMANGTKCLILNYYADGEVTKRMKIGNENSDLSQKEIDILINKGFFTLTNKSKQTGILTIFECKLTDYNMKKFKI